MAAGIGGVRGNIKPIHEVVRGLQNITGPRRAGARQHNAGTLGRTDFRADAGAGAGADLQERRH